MTHYAQLVGRRITPLFSGGGMLHHYADMALYTGALQLQELCRISPSNLLRFAQASLKVKVTLVTSGMCIGPTSKWPQR